MKTSNIKCLAALNGITKPVAIAKTENERIRRTSNIKFGSLTPHSHFLIVGSS